MRRAAGKSDAERHIAFTGTLVPLALFGGALISLGAAIWTRHHTLTALATWFTLQALLIFETRFHLRALSADHTSSTINVPHFFGSGVALWLLLTASLGLGYRSPVQAHSEVQNIVALSILACLFAFASFITRYFIQTPSIALPNRDGLIRWCRSSVWMVGAAFVLSCLIAIGVVEFQRPIVQTMMFLSLIPVMEWLIRTLISDGRSVSLVDDVRVIKVLFTRMNPIQSGFDHLDRNFGVDVRSTWALTFVRRASLRLTLLLVGLAWLSTSLVTINTFETGIYERFGAPVSRNPLGPGLHLKAPWPVGHVHRIETSRIRTMPLGFYGPRKGVSLLWTKQHAAEEYNLLLGDGRDLITVNAILQYKIQNPEEWHYKTQNPEALLRVAAEQALLKNTVERSLDGVLSENTETLVRQIESDIRQRVSDYQIGAEIVGLSLQGLHPPVSVAENYQAVVSAQHEREITILTSRQYKIETLQSARQAAMMTIMTAQANASEITARARGDAEAFRELQAAFANAPEPFEQRLRLQALKEVLDGRSLNLIDDRIEKDGGVLWFQE